MAFDGIVLNSVAYELRNVLINSKVTKIYEPTKTDLIISFYGSAKNLALQINIDPANARIHCTTHAKVNPFQAPNFCMLLRKHLVGARLIQINTFDLERVIELVFETYNELKDKVIKRLIVEVMSSHSNIILASNSYTIIDSIRHVESTSTVVLPAHIYEFPKNIKVSILELKGFDEFVSIIGDYNNSPIDKILSDHFTGISRSFIQSRLNVLGLSSVIANYENLLKLYNDICNVASHFEQIVLRKLSDSKDFIIDLSPRKDVLSVNYFLDDFYYIKEIDDSFSMLKRRLLTTISSNLKKYNRRLENIEEKLKECEDMETYRLFGELITSNLYRFSPHMQLDKITVNNYYDNNVELVIPLDKKYSISKNAERYFKKYNKLKSTLKVVSIQKSETILELDYIQSILFSIENANTISELEDIFAEMQEANLFGNKNINSLKVKAENKSQPTEFSFRKLYSLSRQKQ